MESAYMCIRPYYSEVYQQCQITNDLAQRGLLQKMGLNSAVTHSSRLEFLVLARDEMFLGLQKHWVNIT